MTTYFITGANRGLGLEFARQLSKRGADTTIIATAREPAKALELARLVHQVLPLDVAEATSIASLSDQLKGRAIDVVINNAGVGGGAKKVSELDPTELSRVYAVNAFAPLLVTKALLANLTKGEKKVVFNITSQLGSIANNSGGSTYSYRGSKAALNQMTVSLANELRTDGYTCVAVHPGWVQTDMGGPNATLKPEESVSAMLKLLDRLNTNDSGKFFNYDGTPLPW